MAITGKQAPERKNALEQMSKDVPASEACAQAKRLEAFAFEALAKKLAMPANGFGFFTCFLLRRLFVVVTKLHLTEDAFTLKLLLKRAQRLIYVIIANDYLQRSTALSKLGHVGLDRGAAARYPVADQQG